MTRWLAWMAVMFLAAIMAYGIAYITLQVALEEHRNDALHRP